jgi:hypothetical protein
MQRTLQRLRGEFLEMPGLRLTVSQAQRLCGVDPAICKAILDALGDEIPLHQAGWVLRPFDGRRGTSLSGRSRSSNPRSGASSEHTQPCGGLNRRSRRVPGSDGNPAPVFSVAGTSALTQNGIRALDAGNVRAPSIDRGAMP